MVARIIPFDEQGTLTALEVIANGGILAFPTDTVYGVGCNALDGDAIRTVFAAKHRPATVPLPVLLAHPHDLASVARDISDLAFQIAELAWPGALTLVLKANAHVPSALVAGGTTIGVRIPDYPVLRHLIEQARVPLAGTSANRHGAPNPLTAEDVQRQIGDTVPLILDGGRSGDEQPSTILDLSTNQPRILRSGAFDLNRLSALPELHTIIPSAD